jgi:hypothetical protein
VSASSEVRLVPVSREQRDEIEEAVRYIALDDHDVTVLHSVVAAWDAAAGGEAAAERSLSSRGDAVWTVDDLPHLLDEPEDDVVAEIHRTTGGERLAAGAAPRFVIRDDPPDFGAHVSRVIVDTLTGQEYYAGGGEPEDQTIHRDWRWIVPLLNELAGGERPSVRVSDDEMREQNETHSALVDPGERPSVSLREIVSEWCRANPAAPVSALISLSDAVNTVEREAEEGERDA